MEMVGNYFPMDSVAAKRVSLHNLLHQHNSVKKVNVNGSDNTSNKLADDILIDSLKQVQSYVSI